MNYLFPRTSQVEGNYESMSAKPAFTTDWITNLITDKRIEEGDMILRNLAQDFRKRESWYVVEGIVEHRELPYGQYDKCESWPPFNATNHYYRLKVRYATVPETREGVKATEAYILKAKETAPI